MSDLLNKITNLLELAYSEDPNVEITIDQPIEKWIGGSVISVIFEGMSRSERQDYIWDYLDKALDKSESRNIGFIVTLTPNEKDVMDEIF